MSHTHKTIRMPNDLLKAIEKMAQAENRSVSNMIVQLLQKAVAQ